MSPQSALAATSLPEGLEDKKLRAAAWFSDLRDRICAAFEAIEDDAVGALSDRPAAVSCASPGPAPTTPARTAAAASPR